MPRRTLVVTNDFPPKRGGIESFVFELTRRLDPGSVAVYTSSSPGARDHDAGLPFPVHRDRASVLLPTPRVARRAAALLRAEACDSVLFGAAAPLGLLGAGLRDAGARRVVGLTHGHETWWARVPVARRALRRIGDSTDALTYLGEHSRQRIARALSPAAAQRMVRLAPGVDTTRFRPGSGGPAARERWGVAADRPVVLCVGRLTPRKGQDVLVRALPHVLRAVPQAVLVLVGEGPYRPTLERLVREAQVGASVLLVGAVSDADLPGCFDGADVFAMPCRDVRRGLEHEGLGMVFLEASATGLPVVVGSSGGAPDACRDGETGFVVDGTDPVLVADRLTRLLTDRELAVRMGRAGMAWTRGAWQWDGVVATLRALLSTDQR